MIGQPGSISALTIPSVSFNDGAIPVQSSPGSFAVNLVYSVSGSVLYWSAARPVPAAQLTLAGASTSNGSTGATGSYTINGISAGNYTLTPQKPTADGVGISAFDASLALQHDAQLATLTGAALTAADVNRNGQVTAQDAFLILQHAAGLTTLPFPGAGQVWFFDPASRSISGLSGNLGAQSFTPLSRAIEELLPFKIDEIWLRPVRFSLRFFKSDRLLAGGFKYRTPQLAEDRINVNLRETVASGLINKLSPAQ